jgi:RND family efflux transporter MFP subunit
VGVLLLIMAYLGSAWAVHKYTKPGHISIIEAQAMDMAVMKPPVGAVPVAVMAAKQEPLESTVQYTGTVVPFQDQEVTPRVTGTIAWMPFYPGNRVRRGQVVARLDAAEFGSKAHEQAANVQMIEHAAAIARIQFQQALGTKAQALAQVQEAQNDVASARSELEAAQQEVVAAQDERTGTQADLQSAQTGVTDAQAQRTAAQADQKYWSAQLKRSQMLFQSGVISQQKYQQDQAEAENASARVRQAEAHIQQAEATVRAAQARLQKAEALIAGAEARVAQMQADLQARQSRVAQAVGNADAMTSAAEAARHEIIHTQAGVQQAQAQLTTARVVADYTEIRAEVDGVITQRLVSPGQLVQPGQALMRISQISPIRLQINVAASDLPNIHIGNRVRTWTMQAPRHPITACVTSLFPAADPTARTSIVEAVLPNTDRRFLTGDYVTMDIATGENRNALVVPANALVWQPQATSDVLATTQTPAVWVIEAGQPEKTIYTCTMHPQIKQDKPGKCPI